jgi:hypothetical protein
MRIIFDRFKITFKRPPGENRQRGQSMLELALVLPVLLILLLGIVEVALFLGRYLDLLDLTREAARFASVRGDPASTMTISTNAAGWNCGPGTNIPFDFYYDTTCVFSPPSGSSTCTDANWCNGLNSTAVLNPATDDIVISAFTITNSGTHGTVTNTWPAPNSYYALSDHDSDTGHNANWSKDCQGNTVLTTPYFTQSRIQSELSQPDNKGFVAVELYYCYHQVIGVPIFTQFLPYALRIHVYTVMPLPAAQPTPTPRPVTP